MPDSKEQPVINNITATLISFIRSIGIAIHEGVVDEKTFLPGIEIRNGELIIDKKKLLYPGDLLHEAGHIAVAPAGERPLLNEEIIKASKSREAEEMMAIAWSYAACIHLNIDPLIVFHEQGYKGGGKSIVENFSQKHYFGVPMLQWIGLTADEKRARELQVAPYPAMIQWVR
jgi:hypothetical protein